MGIIKTIGILGTALALTLSSPKYAATDEFGRISGYYDTRGKYTATFEGGTTNLPLGTKLFGFVNMETEEGNPDNLNKAYSEIRLSKKGETDLGVAGEYNGNFSEPGTIRLGLIYEPELPEGSRFGMKFYPVSSNNKGMQLGLNGKYEFSDDFWIEGFLDYNFDPAKIVTEIQVGKKIKDNLGFVVEGRYNGFEEDNFGVGIGLDWAF